MDRVLAEQPRRPYRQIAGQTRTYMDFLSCCCSAPSEFFARKKVLANMRDSDGLQSGKPGLAGGY
jgi:hypothetical protein